MKKRTTIPRTNAVMVIPDGFQTCGEAAGAWCASANCRLSRSISSRSCASVLVVSDMLRFRRDSGFAFAFFQPVFVVNRWLLSQICIDDGDDEERRYSGEKQSADDGAAEGRVLFAAFTESEGHGKHSQHHGGCRH